MTENTYIELKNLSIGFQSGKEKKVLFSRMNSAFNAASFIGIVGNNGLGKSTLIRTICGLQRPIDGSVLVHNKNVTDIVQPELARMLSVVLTERVNGFNLTVFDFVASGRTPYTNAFHVLTKNDETEIHEAIIKCGLESFKNTRLDELSDGLYQKAAIAKAVAQKTTALILDEPSAYLDFSSKHALFNDLKQFSQREQKCILVSSHDLDLVISYCSHMLILASENRYALIKTEDCFQNPLFQEMTNGFFKKH